MVAMEAVCIRDRTRTRQVQAVATNIRQRIGKIHLRAYCTQAYHFPFNYSMYITIYHSYNFLFI